MDYHDSARGTAPALDPTASAADGPVTGSGVMNRTTAFLAELARAMHVAAGQEHERIVAAVAEDASAHVERTQARAATESDELRRLANEDVERIRTWSATEIERIQAEAARRTDERRHDLEEYLQQHDAIIATEVEGVHLAVQDYRATLDTYFDELTGSSDPAMIAARAGSLPPPPDLDTVRALARSSAVARFAEGPAATVGDDPGGPAGADGSPSDQAAAAEPSPADADDPQPVEDGAVRVGVMDPEAIGAAGELPDERPVAGPNGDAPAEPGNDGGTDSGSEEHASAAVRLLRSIAPWTAPTAVEEPPDSTTQTQTH